MSLTKRIFGSPKDKEAPASVQPDGAPSEHFHNSDSTQTSESRNAPKRELVQVMLRDTMRKHGIPSDWVDCRMLSAVTRGKRPGLHAQFIVRHGRDRLLSYVFAFQDSFMRELLRLAAHAADWLLS